MLICTLVWFMIYDIYLVVVKHASIGFLQFVGEMLFLRSVNMSHVWYLPTILGLYILLPFVASALMNYDNKLFLPPMILFTVYLFGFGTAETVYRIFHPGSALSIQFSSGFSGGVYGLYILYGYFINAGVFKRIKSLIMGTLSMLSFLAVVIIQVWSYQNGIAYNVWYNNLFILTASIGIFELASRMIIIHGYTLIKLIARCSFAVYLIHNIVIGITASCIRSAAIIMPVQVFLLWSISTAVSIVTSIIISKIPKVGKYILYMK